MRQNTPAYRQGDFPGIKTIFLLSAPGKMEDNAGRPAAGETGKTLEIALEILHKKDAHAFPSVKLDDYTIANAVEEIHYKAKTGRTEGNEKEITVPRNMARINKILENSHTVIALGEKAQLAVKKSTYKKQLLTANHPSLVSLNSKYKSDKRLPKERRIDRTRQWVEDLIKTTRLESNKNAHRSKSTE